MATPTTLPATFVSGNVLTAAQMNDLRGAFRVLQVVSTTKTDTFSATVAIGTTTALTGFTVTITPSSTSSKILITYDALLIWGNTNYGMKAILTRGGTAIAGATGDAAGNRTRISSLGQNGTQSFTFLDSPSTTSATTYGLIIGHTNTNAADSNVVYLNRYGTDTDSAQNGWRSASTITAMEISA
jgi:hypothetical protein